MPEFLFPERNEYIDKYLFPFEKGEILEDTGTQYFELTISIGKFLTDETYISNIQIPVDLKYLVLDVKFDMESNKIQSADWYDPLTGRGEFQMLERINAELDVILPLTQIEYLYTGFQYKNIAKMTNLKTLVLEHCDMYYPLDDLPASLIRLDIHVGEFSTKLDNLPAGLKALAIDTGGIGDYCSGYPHLLNYLPQSLEILYWPETISMDSADYPANLENLPSGLKYLYLGCFDCLSKATNYDAIPDSVEVIVFHNYESYVNKINKYPAGLKKIYTNCNLFYNYYHIFNPDLPFDKIIEIKERLIENGYFGKFKIYTDTSNISDVKEYKKVFD